MKNLITTTKWGLFNNITEKQLEDYRKNELIVKSKEMQTMFDLLQDAERYLLKEEYGPHYQILEVLTNYIKDYVKII